MEMMKQILIPLKRRDRIDEMIPYVEKVARPGMRVIFLIPRPVDLFGWFEDHFVNTESVTRAIHAALRIGAKYSVEGQRRLAERIVAPARDALQRQGVEVAVDVYKGGVKRAVQRL
jgi:hypothetical protein